MAGWGLDIPVIDVAIKARALPDRQALTFPVDGHLNEAGHAYIAQEAAPALQAFLAGAGRTTLRASGTAAAKIQHVRLQSLTRIPVESRPWQAHPIAGKIMATTRQSRFSGAFVLLQIVNYPHPALRYSPDP